MFPVMHTEQRHNSILISGYSPFSESNFHCTWIEPVQYICGRALLLHASWMLHRGNLNNTIISNRYTLYSEFNQLRHNGKKNRYINHLAGDSIRHLFCINSKHFSSARHRPGKSWLGMSRFTRFFWETTGWNFHQVGTKAVGLGEVINNNLNNAMWI